MIRSVKCGLCEMILNTAERQWLEHLGNYENMFETGIVQANEC